MDRQYVDSSMIKSIGYDAPSSTLEVEFKAEVVWQYHGLRGGCSGRFMLGLKRGLYRAG